MKRKHSGRPLGMAGQPWSPHDRALLNRYLPASKGALSRCGTVALVLWSAAIVLPKGGR